jgi:DNA-binding NtrC family response regulator
MQLPIVMISGSPTALSDLTGAGCDLAEFLPKPLDPDLLLRTLDRVLGDCQSPPFAPQP